MWPLLSTDEGLSLTRWSYKSWILIGLYFYLIGPLSNQRGSKRENTNFMQNFQMGLGELKELSFDAKIIEIGWKIGKLWLFKDETKIVKPYLWKSVIFWCYFWSQNVIFRANGKWNLLWNCRELFSYSYSIDLCKKLKILKKKFFSWKMSFQGVQTSLKWMKSAGMYTCLQWNR